MESGSIIPLVKGSVSECAKVLYDFGVCAKVILELGVESGKSTKILLKACEIGDGHLWSVDINQHTTEFKDHKSWTFIQMDDLEYGKTWNKTIDLLFIDTSHTRDHTFKELELYSKFINNGIIVLHDTMAYPECREGVYDFLNAHKGEWIFTELGYISGCGMLWRRDIVFMSINQFIDKDNYIEIFNK
jgi:hypothetical protein